MREPLSGYSIIARSKEQIFRILGDEVVVLNLKSCVYYGLDPIGAHIWNLLGDLRSVAEIQDSLLETYEVEAECCERDLLDLLDELRAEGLVEVDGTTRSQEATSMGSPVRQEQKVLCKKPYSLPRLTMHGTVQELTKRNGQHGQLDGGSGRTPRTHV